MSGGGAFRTLDSHRKFRSDDSCEQRVLSWPMQLEAEKRAAPSGAVQLSLRRFQSDREYRNDLVVTIDDDDLVADDEVPESPPLGMDVHDD